MNRELIKDEIRFTDSECCIIFDFGCYFPYSNIEILTFDFSLGMEEFDDYKINHRYPNKGYQTISKKYGRKVSKVGYPYIMKLDEQSPILLCLKVGIKKQYITMIFPLQTNMTKDKPTCALSFQYDFVKSEFYFISHEKAENQCWYHHIWRNYEVESDKKSDSDVLLNTPCKVGDDSYTFLYDNIIEPCPATLSDLML
jgi:hypothetical protein